MSPFDDAFEQAVASAERSLGVAPSPDAEFDIALLGAAGADLPDLDADFAPDAEFDAVMIGSGAVPVVRPVLPPQPLPVVRAAVPAAAPKKKKQRSLDFSFGYVWGTAGFVTTITVRPQCVFRVEKMMLTDNSSNPGFGTSIVQVTVGQKIQRPGTAGRGTLSTFFSQNALADGIKLDTAHEWEDIALTVSFIQECTFYANLFGSAEIEE